MNGFALSAIGRHLSRLGEEASAGDPFDDRAGERSIAGALGPDNPVALADMVAALETVSRALVEGVRVAPDFARAYTEGRPPWDIGRPQPALQALADAGALVGPVLDVGCGTGEHALMAAAIGLEALGVDLAEPAIATAGAKARDRGLADRASFVTGDALQLGTLGRQYRTVIDSGFFHVLDDEQRRTYIDGLAASTEPGSRYFLLCFSDRMPGTWGPRRMTQEEIRSSFARDWDVEAIDGAVLVTLMMPEVPAWLAKLTRR